MHSLPSPIKINRTKWLAATAALLGLHHAAVAVPIPTASFASPFGSFDAAGKRRVVGWQANGSTKVKMGVVSLTHPAPDQTGALWSSGRADLAEEFSLESKFRISGVDSSSAGDSLGWFLVKDNKLQEGRWYGVDPKFTGIALVITTEHPDSTGDAMKDMQKVVSIVAGMVSAQCLACHRRNPHLPMQISWHVVTDRRRRSSCHACWFRML